LLGGLLLAFGSGCQLSNRTLSETAPLSARAGSMEGSRQPGASGATQNPYEGNDLAMTEGQRLYDWYNCSGCHARGGGGIGPALMADLRRYGKAPDNIYTSIVDGRPNRTPARRGKKPEYQVRHVVTYVQTLRADRPIAAPAGP